MPGVRHRIHALAKLPQLNRPGIVRPIRAKRLLERLPSSAASGTDGRHGPAVTNHDIGLPAPLYIVQDLRKPAGRIGGTQLLHKIRLSDLCAVTIATYCNSADASQPRVAMLVADLCFTSG